MNEKLIQLRHKKNKSQCSVANDLGISQSMLSSLESGQRKGSDEMKAKIANYYGRSIQYIFFSN